MQLIQFENEHFELAADWLSQKENYQWLEFAGRGQTLSAVNLRLMVQRNLHCIRLFTGGDRGEPIGIVALSDISPLSKSATLWYVLGEKSVASRGFTSQAVAAMLNYGFGSLEMMTCQAWAVPENQASVRVLEKNGFQFIGKQRCCHYLDGRLVDRFLFDLLATEHKARQ